jgi:hypothetical protein
MNLDEITEKIDNVKKRITIIECNSLEYKNEIRTHRYNLNNLGNTIANVKEDVLNLNIKMNQLLNRIDNMTSDLAKIRK